MAPPPSAPSLTLRRRNSAVVVMMSTALMVLCSINMGLSQSIVEYLPGFPGKLPFKLQTGYIGVGEKEEVELFYYFIESEGNPENDPLVLWLTGGPGCSGLSGLLYEIGPIGIDYAKSSGSIPALLLHEYSWTKVANIIFLDSPVGTGFSYAKSEEASYSNDTSSAMLTYDFLRKWLMNHPKYLKNPLYICGDSYSGITLPLVVDHVYKGLKLGREPQMNMKGYSLGNALTDKFNDNNGKISYAYRMGLLSNGLYQSAKELCHGNYIQVDQENVLCQNILERVDQCLDKIRKNHILEPWCGDLWGEDGNVHSRHAFLYEDIPRNLLQPAVASKHSWCRDDNYVFSFTWANDESVRKALHVRKGTKADWARCNTSIASSTTHPERANVYEPNIQSTTSYHQEFTHKDSRVLIYSGDHDYNVPHSVTERWIESLKLPIQSDWRPWFVENQIAGYTMTYAQGDYELTYATVKGAGHTAPEYNPVECFAMIQRWFDKSSL